MGAWRPQMNYHFKQRARASSSRYNSNLGPFSPHPTHYPLTVWARPVLTGTSERAAERAGGFGATAHSPGIVAVAIAGIVGLSFRPPRPLE